MTDAAAMRLLTGEDADPRKPWTALRVAEAVSKGLPAAAVTRVKDAAGLTDNELAAILGVHARTLARHARKNPARLETATGDRLFRVAHALARAVEVLGDADGPRRWIREPQPALGGASPLSLLHTEAGTREVLDLLGRVEHGVFE